MIFHKKYIWLLFLYTTTQAYEPHKDLLTSTIYAPQPLTRIHFDTTTNSIRSSIDTTKNYSPALALIFFANITETSLYQDFVNKPFLAGCSCYGIITTYFTYIALQKKHILYLTIKDNLQNIFNLLVIGYGIYNKMTYHYYFSMPLKFSLTPLQQFLQQAYESWLTISNFYHKHYKNEPVFIYQIKNIDFIDVLQATQNEIEILPAIINFYHEPYDVYDFETILTYLEAKLKSINRNIHTLDFDL